MTPNISHPVPLRAVPDDPKVNLVHSMMRTGFSPTLLDKKANSACLRLRRLWGHSGVLVAIFTVLVLDPYCAFMINGGPAFLPDLTGLIDESIDFLPHSAPSIHLVLLSIPETWLNKATQCTRLLWYILIHSRMICAPGKSLVVFSMHIHIHYILGRIYPYRCSIVTHFSTPHLSMYVRPSSPLVRHPCVPVLDRYNIQAPVGVAMANHVPQLVSIDIDDTVRRCNVART